MSRSACTPAAPCDSTGSIWIPARPNTFCASAARSVGSFIVLNASATRISTFSVDAFLTVSRPIPNASIVFRAVSPFPCAVSIAFDSFASCAGAVFPPAAATWSICFRRSATVFVSATVPPRASLIVFDSFTRPICSVRAWTPRCFARLTHSDEVAVSAPVIFENATVDFASWSVWSTADFRYRAPP